MATLVYHTSGPSLWSQTPTGSISARGQTFTPSANWTITSVGLYLYKFGNPGTLTLNIYATSGGLPTGGILAFGTTNADTLPTASPGELREITLSGIQVTPFGGCKGNEQIIEESKEV